MERKLDFIIAGNEVPISLSHLDSDDWGNLVIMEQVVGTLIKYTEAGNYQPFLVERWETSTDEKVWKFYFRNGLTAENGESIDAFSYNESLRRVLRIYSKFYDPPMFNQLLGWSEFKKGNPESLGVKVIDQHTLLMTFANRPSGVLEFLSMPYFGYFSGVDFDGAGKWRDQYKITASGAYKIISATKSLVELEARPGWPTLRKNAPNYVRVMSKSLEEALRMQDSATIISLKSADDRTHRGFKKFTGTPTVLTALVLSPFIPPFDKKEVRNAFRTIVRQLYLKTIEGSSELKKSLYFYPNSTQIELTNQSYDDALEILRGLGSMNVRGFRQALTNQRDIDVISNLLTEVSRVTGWTFEMDSPETGGTNWQENAYSNRYFPLRVARVDIGGNPENWVVEMMFCSTLGVSFPDSENLVCDLVKDYSNNKISNMNEYGRRLHEAIEKDSSVVPLLHSGFGWLVSDNVNVENLSPTMNLPRFDHLEIKK